MQLVIAAITTEPCSSSPRWPSIATGTAAAAVVGLALHVVGERRLPRRLRGARAARGPAAASARRGSARPCARSSSSVSLNSGVRRVGRPEEPLRLRSTPRPARPASASRPVQPQVGERLVVDREEADRRAVLGRHVGDRGAVGERQAREARAEELDELPDHALLAQHLGDGEHEVGRGRAARRACRAAGSRRPAGSA